MLVGAIPQSFYIYKLQVIFTVYNSDLKFKITITARERMSRKLTIVPIPVVDSKLKDVVK